MAFALRELSHAECYEILEHARFGHLACCRDGQPYIAANLLRLCGKRGLQFFDARQEA